MRQAIQPLLRINMIHADQSPQLDIELMRCSTTNPRRSHLLHSPPSRHLATRLLLETRHQLLSLRLTCSARELGRRPSTNSADGCSHARARSAAQSLYPHLPSAAREPVKQSTPTLATLSGRGQSRRRIGTVSRSLLSNRIFGKDALTSKLQKDMASPSKQLSKSENWDAKMKGASR